MKRLTRSAFGVAFALAFATMAGSRASAGADAIQPLPPGDTHYGMKMADWATAWCQWFLSLPNVVQPDLRFDKTGVHAGVGQHTPVWFLPGYIPGLSGTRTFTIPDGQAILLNPMFEINWDTPGAQTEAELLSGLQTPPFIDDISVLEVSLDGAPVPDIESYRVTTSLFSVTLPPANVVGVTVAAGKDARIAAVGDGYWLLFPPLPVGTHVLSQRVEGKNLAGLAYKSEWTFNLVIQAPNEPIQ